MKISYNWLKSKFNKDFPEDINQIVDLFTFHSFEVEGVEDFGNDKVIDVKVLPDRAHYALSHQGIAEELSAIANIPILEKDKNQSKISVNKEIRKLDIKILDTDFCKRYSARLIENINLKKSPDQRVNFLNAASGRSINYIVDVTNFVMFDIGQPLHAFDADKVHGSIFVRKANEGEKIIILDGTEVILSSSDHVIADEKGPLAIAGIKGGKRAEVTENTKNIILESANFNSVSVRKTSSRIGIRNESSKRYENKITPELAIEGLNLASEIICSENTDARFGEVIDIYHSPEIKREITTSAEFISKMLGLDIPVSKVIELLNRQKIETALNGKVIVATIPFKRYDLQIENDLVEEVGRLYGYNNIPPKPLARENFILVSNPLFHYSEKIKNFLIDSGYSEAYLYSLTNHGHFELTYPASKDKAFLREEISPIMEIAIEKNYQNSPILGMSEIKIFEIGNVFTEKGEYTSLAVGCKLTKKIKGKNSKSELSALIQNLSKYLGITSIPEKLYKFSKSGEVLELNLNNLLEILPEVQKDDSLTFSRSDFTFIPFSVYPFILRDIAIFVDKDTKADDVLNLIIDNAGELLIRQDLFDVFEKDVDGKKMTSYAFHLVFQAKDRTLTDSEVNVFMNKITEKMVNSGFIVR